MLDQTTHSAQVSGTHTMNASAAALQERPAHKPDQRTQELHQKTTRPPRGWPPQGLWAAADHSVTGMASKRADSTRQVTTATPMAPEGAGQAGPWEAPVDRIGQGSAMPGLGNRSACPALDGGDSAERTLRLVALMLQTLESTRRYRGG